MTSLLLAKTFGITCKNVYQKRSVDLTDHNPRFAPITILQKPGTNDRAKFFSDPRAMEIAREQWVKDHKGGFSDFYQ